MAVVMSRSHGGVVSFGASGRALALTLTAVGSWCRVLSRGGCDLLGGYCRSLGKTGSGQGVEVVLAAFGEELTELPDKLKRVQGKGESRLAWQPLS